MEDNFVGPKWQAHADITNLPWDLHIIFPG